MVVSGGAPRQMGAPRSRGEAGMILQTIALTRRYGDVVANDAISMDVAAGEIHGLLGPNGAGKSTLVRQVMGLIRPTAGRILLGGIDVASEPSAAKRQCSYQPQAPVGIEGLTPREFVGLVGRL